MREGVIKEGEKICVCVCVCVCVCIIYKKCFYILPKKEKSEAFAVLVIKQNSKTKKIIEQEVFLNDHKC